jgi:hypothetical protein
MLSVCGEVTIGMSSICFGQCTVYRGTRFEYVFFTQDHVGYTKWYQKTLLIVSYILSFAVVNHVA